MYGWEGCCLVLLFWLKRHTLEAGAVQDHPGWEAGCRCSSQAGPSPRETLVSLATTTHCPVLSPGGQAGGGRQPTGRDPDTARGGGEGRTGDAGMTIYPSHRLQAALGDTAPCLLPSDTSFLSHFLPSSLFLLRLCLCIFIFDAPFFPFLLSTPTNHPHLSLLCHRHPLLHIHAQCQEREPSSQLDLVQVRL